MNKILKYFWKYFVVIFGIELLWYLICFTLGYFFFPNLMRHVSMVGFLIFPFIVAYHTMWKQIDELELFIEAEFNAKQEKEKLADKESKVVEPETIKIKDLKPVVLKTKIKKPRRAGVTIVEDTTPIIDNNEEEF